MKHYITELVLCTIVATVVTLLFYIVGLDSTWQDAANSFGVTFLVMFVLGLWNNRKKENKQ